MPDSNREANIVMPDALRKVFPSIDDALFTAPLRFEDRRTLHCVRDFRDGETVWAQGIIKNITEKGSRTGKRMLVIRCADTNGEAFLVTFFTFNAYHKQLLQMGDQWIFHGKSKNFRGEWNIAQPKMKRLSEMGGIVPIYRKHGRAGTLKVGEAMNALVALADAGDLDTFVPQSLREAMDGAELPPLADALRHLHQPVDLDDVMQALDSLRAMEIGLILARRAAQEKNAKVISKSTVHLSPTDIERMESSLPFALTPSQKNAWTGIREEIEGALAARILLLGGVGSGKSVLAYLAALAQSMGGTEGRRQALIVAPTGILATQLYQRLAPIADALGVPVTQYASGQRKNMIPERGIMVGTHGVLGLLDRLDAWGGVGMVIFDEEHRFGQEMKSIPDGIHRILMSATPIPGTMARVLFGDTRILRIESQPMGRDVESFALPISAAGQAIAAAVDTVKNAGKVVVVYGAISREEQEVELDGPVYVLPFGTADAVVRVNQPKSVESAVISAISADPGTREKFYRINDGFSPKDLLYGKSGEDLLAFPVLLYDKFVPDRLFIAQRKDLMPADGKKRWSSGAVRIRGLCESGCLPSVPLVRESAIRRGKDIEQAAPAWEKRFPGRVAVLHGRMTDADKTQVMDEFAEGRWSVVIATSIVEVGVDIDGVDTVIVANADRMGVASLVQLRGRVGRRGRKGRCYFISRDEDGLERIRRIADAPNDEALAEMDFCERGFGDLLGDAQSGHSGMLFRLPRDRDLLDRLLTHWRVE